MKKKVILISFLAIVIILTCFLKFQNANSNLIGAYVDGEYSSDIPGKDEGYVVEKIDCDNGATGKWDYNSWGILTTNMSKKSKCNVYFKKGIRLADVNTYVDDTGKCPSVNSDGTVNVTSAEDENSLLCSAPDNYGTSYYFRGNVQNNYVKFGKWSDDADNIVYGYATGHSNSKDFNSLEECKNSSSYNVDCTSLNVAGKDMYWRIIRINGDGSIRLIYDGTYAHQNSDDSSDKLIGKSWFNDKKDDNAYVGYMYGTPGSSTYEETHKNTNSSAVKVKVDTWYENNFKNTKYEEYLSDNLFCNDRSFSSANTGTGAGKSVTYYRWGYFLPQNSKIMLHCLQKNDAFTVNDTLNGNGDLKYKVAIISADEVVLGGIYDSASNNNYLYNQEYSWTMSAPFLNNTSSGYVSWHRTFHYSKGINDFTSFSRAGVKPVINLKPGSLVAGEGTMDNPYTVE